MHFKHLLSNERHCSPGLPVPVYSHKNFEGHSNVDVGNGRLNFTLESKFARCCFLRCSREWLPVLRLLMGEQQERVGRNSDGFLLITSIGRLFCTHLRITFSPALGFLEEHSDVLFKIAPFAICLYCRITWKILVVSKILLDTRLKKVFLTSSYHEMFFFFSYEISDIPTEVASA